MQVSFHKIPELLVRPFKHHQQLWHLETKNVVDAAGAGREAL